jgi:glutamate racemase
MSTLSNQPIGIFDSGIGGLTVTKAITELLPNESIIYFGDLAHLPYGDKSPEAIQTYSLKICELLLNQKCKLILIACNSAASAAYAQVKEYVGDKAYVFDVIEPVIHYLKDHHAQQCVGLIGTKQTVNSQVFNQKIAALNLDIKLKSLATSLLVPLIEEGFISPDLIDGIIQRYLSHPTFQNIQALVLGCTHYPLIKTAISTHFQHKIPIIDSSQVVANTLQAWLTEANLLSTTTAPMRKFYVSDYTPFFADTAKRFFQNEIMLEHYPMWV